MPEKEVPTPTPGLMLAARSPTDTSVLPLTIHLPMFLQQAAAAKTIG